MQNNQFIAFEEKNTAFNKSFTIEILTLFLPRGRVVLALWAYEC